jgi:tRNA1(Val) A37 N6-methylase TrmN6
MDLEGKDVLELGAGTGICGIFIAKNNNCRRVLITDGVEESVELIRENLEMNGVEGEAEVF